MSDFVGGVFSFLKGWKYIFSHRSLLAVAIVPFFISAGAAVAGLFLIVNYFTLWAGTFVTLLGSWLTPLLAQLLTYPLMALAGVAMMAAVFYAVYLLHAVFAAPFYALLAERTLQLSGKSQEPFPTWKAWAGNMVTMLRVSLTKGLIFALLGIFLFLFSLVPVVNVLALVGTLMVLAYDCIDYSLEAKRLRFRQRIQHAFNHKAQWTGTAFGLALTLLIPGLTLLVIPGVVVGAALNLKDTDGSRVTAPKNP